MLRGKLLLTLASALVAAAFVLPEASRATPAPELHFQLKTSAPMADSTVAPTGEVRLWFTQEPQDGTTQVRVMKGDVRVPMTEAQEDAEDPTSYFLTIERPLSPGDYRVLWRSMAGDGHVVNGDFGFTVAAADAPPVHAASQPIRSGSAR